MQKIVKNRAAKKKKNAHSKRLTFSYLAATSSLSSVVSA